MVDAQMIWAMWQWGNCFKIYGRLSDAADAQMFWAMWALSILITANRALALTRGKHASSVTRLPHRDGIYEKRNIADKIRIMGPPWLPFKCIQSLYKRPGA